MIAAGIFSFFWNYDDWASGSPVFLKYFILLISLVLAAGSLKSSNWHGWVYFSADNKRLYFPSSQLKRKSIEILHVLWSDVGTIQSEVFYDGHKGVSIEISISNDEIQSFFANIAPVNKLLGFNQVRNGYFLIGYANNSFQKIPDVVAQLTQMKRDAIGT